MTEPFVVCLACPGAGRRVKRHGLCAACLRRWYRLGKPTELPPPLPPARRCNPAIESVRAARCARIEDYIDLTRSMSETREAAVQRLGVSLRTARRYETDLKLLASARRD